MEIVIQNIYAKKDEEEISLFSWLFYSYSLSLTILKVHEEMKNGKKSFILIPRKREEKNMTWIQIHINNESSYFSRRLYMSNTT